jgi:hypothetical protein
MRIPTAIIVDASGKDAEPSPFKNRKIPQSNVEAILKSDSFVAYARLRGVRQVFVVLMTAA